MPIRAPIICPRCDRPKASGLRCACGPRERAPDNRPSARQRGYTAEWEREAKAFLKDPANRYCACGCGRLADMVDHEIPHRGDMNLFWNRSNWQPMASSPCHASRKQRLERREQRMAGGGSTSGGGARTGAGGFKRISSVDFSGRRQ